MAVVACSMVFGLVYLVKSTDKKRDRNVEKAIADSKVAYDSALDSLFRDPKNESLKSLAVEKGHAYYQFIGIRAYINVKKLPPDQISLLNYRESYQARDNRVQADIKDKIKL